MNVKFTLFKSINDNRVLDYQRCECSWEEFCEEMGNVVLTPNKHSVELITPASYVPTNEAVEFNPDGSVRRCKANIAYWHMLPIDVDGNMTLAQAIKKFKKYEYVLYTSHSHQTASKGYKDCFRMFFLLKEPVSNSEFERRLDAIQEFLGECDASSTSVSRQFYIPSCAKENYKDSIYYNNKGIALDLMAFAAKELKVYEPTEKYKAPDDDFKKVVLEKLYELQNVDYEGKNGAASWWKICSAMQNGGYTCSEFETLSQFIRSHRDNDCKAQWRSSQNKHISFGYLVNILKQQLGEDCFKK